MTILIEESMYFLKRIWNYRDTRALCYTIVWINNYVGYKHFCKYSGSDHYADVEDWLRSNLLKLTEQKYHIYYQVLPLSRKPEYGRGRESDVAIGKWLWIDLDYKRDINVFEIPQEFSRAINYGYSFFEENNYALRGVYWDKHRKKWILVNRPSLDSVLETIFNKIGIEPTIVVDSGNGYHIYFELEEVLEAKYVSRLEEKIVDKLNGDPQSKDLARILRLPGSINPRNNRVTRVIFDSNTTLDPRKYLLDLMY